jgi:hypothetical protein
MSPTGIVAWWGAILSTVVFLWDVYKYRTAGPKLRLEVSTGMKSVNMPQYDGKTLIMGNVTNFGDRPTTITHFALQGYKKKWHFGKIRVAGQSGIVPIPNTGQPLPFELKPGAVWTGIAFQETVEAWGTEGIVYLFVHHSHSKKPLSKRVVIKKELVVAPTKPA